MTEFRPTATTYREGSKTLPGVLYTAPAILADEMERLFAKTWNCVGRASRLEKPGDYFVREIAGESIVAAAFSVGVLVMV